MNSAHSLARTGTAPVGITISAGAFLLLPSSRHQLSCFQDILIFKLLFYNNVYATCWRSFPPLGNQLQPYATALEQAFEIFWDGLPEQTAARLSDLDKQTALEHEAAFVDKVYSAVSQLAETHEGPITALFDVNETIARNTFGRDGSMTTFVRPGFGVLVRALNQTFGERIDFGLLTSRAQSHLEEELTSPSYTQAIVGKINPDFVISSRDGNLLMEH